MSLTTIERVIATFSKLLDSIRYGRKKVLIINVIIDAFLGSIKSFSPNYITYLIAEFLNSAFGAGIYLSAFILGIEQVPPKYRVICSAIMYSAFSIGEMIVGIVAWLYPSWRIMLRILYMPLTIFISYYWLIDESVRWLIIKGRTMEAKLIVQKIANKNYNESISFPHDLKTLRFSGKDLESADSIQSEVKETAIDVFLSPVMLVRVISCCIVWTSVAFVYYGLMMHAVAISENYYLNFIAMAFVEVPAQFVIVWMLSRFGRKMTLIGSLILEGVTSIGFIFIPDSDGFNYLELVLFLVGKFVSTISFAAVYIYTVEMLPTTLRTSLTATCSIFGRMGAMLAPQIPLLASIWQLFPPVLFATVALISGVLSLTFPETLNTKLPNTIEEAINIGKTKQENEVAPL